MRLTHIGEQGNSKMVNVEGKALTNRVAVASGRIIMSKDAINAIRDGQVKKGDVLSVAQVAGIMASKKTYELIPMCHNVILDGIDISYNFVDNNTIEATATAVATQKTGVEMEAIVAVSVCLMTIYDMVKAIDKEMVISDIKLLSKSGGKSGDFVRSL